MTRKELKRDSSTKCAVCCNVIVEYDEEKGIKGDDAIHVMHGYIECVLDLVAIHMKHL